MKSIQISGIETAYSDEGAGPAVVLLHGFPLDNRIFQAVSGDLSSKWRVICPDLRGFGRSGPSGAFSINTLADDAFALINALGLAPCVLGGLSMGGYVAQAFAGKYPALLKGLILMDTKADADSPEAKAGRDKMIQTVRSLGSKAVATAMLPKMLAPETATDRPEIKAELRDIMESCPPETIEHALLAMRDRDDFHATLSEFHRPTLLVFGQHDLLTPPAVGQSLQSAVPDAELALIPAAGHLSPMENPQAVAEAIDRFLQWVNTASKK